MQFFCLQNNRVAGIYELTLSDNPKVLEQTFFCITHFFIWLLNTGPLPLITLNHGMKYDFIEFEGGVEHIEIPQSLPSPAIYFDLILSFLGIGHMKILSEEFTNG